jgi:succinate-semialdehyde dehydrogenase
MTDEIITRNPATGAEIARHPVDDGPATERTLARSRDGFRGWRETPIERRAAVLSRLGETLTEEVEHLAGLITTEMGKTIGEARAEVRKCATLARWMAENGPALLADERAPVEEAEVWVSFLPIGTVLGIMPWNFPLWQALRAAIPIMLGGNGFLHKPAPNVLGCAYALQSAMERCGVPDGVFGTLNIGNDATGALVGDPRIAGVTLTGSVRAGGAVAALAGKAIKKSLLELGGSDPFIVLADADLDAAVENGIKARFQNAGQVCLAAKRFILEAPIAADFTARFVAAAKGLAVGDPMDEATRIGPIARADLRDGLHAQVEATRRAGAAVLLGGAVPDGAGYFYEPTVLGGVGPGMSAFDEETFGPVAAMTVAADADEAVALANDSAFGLSGNLWTKDAARARSIARRLETGGVFINGFTASDPRVPVGGVKQSGYGRELSHFGLREFVNAQTVWVKG